LKRDELAVGLFNPRSYGRRRSPSANRQAGFTESLANPVRGGTRFDPGSRQEVAMAGRSVQKITPFLWYAKEAEEAARFYASIFPDSRVTSVTALPADSPSGPAGSVKVVEFTLFGQGFTAMSAGPLDPFNHAISFVVSCDDQAELDRYWNALLDGGSPEQCGWLKDRYGVSWQIVPSIMNEMMTSPDRDRSRRAAQAMLKMVKLDIAGLQAAFDGR
jgi:predicted 3-demethylubiquinone-9 3-methyltransferase (glyoxalase superfamily)